LHPGQIEGKNKLERGERKFIKGIGNRREEIVKRGEAIGERR